jgi:hypothetical protein
LEIELLRTAGHQAGHGAGFFADSGFFRTFRVEGVSGAPELLKNAALWAIFRGKCKRLHIGLRGLCGGGARWGSDEICRLQ